jgi:AcrR family transcriptional regulator
MDEVARRAGVSVQTIYTNFGSKRGLVLAAIDDMQREIGLYDDFDAVFASRDGEAAMRRMLHATFRLWDRGWPLVAFTLRARRIDPELGAQLAEVDTMRRTHLWVICRRLDAEARLKTPGAAEPAADIAFALSTPTVFEELVHVRGWPADHAAATIADIVIEAIVDPATPSVTDPPPDWGALGLGARTPSG